MPIEIHDGVPWIYRSRSCGDLPADALSEVLTWILEQLNFGHFVVERDSEGDGVSLTLGQAAALAKPLKQDAAVDFAGSRERSIVVAGLFARARERGVEPEYADLSDTANVMARQSPNGRMNTDFHYAFELTSLLRRIADATFLFDAPPILGRADPKVVEMLGEATRCLLFGLSRSSVAICRACMEGALRSVVRPDKLLNERWKTKRGEVECLINVAIREGFLNESLGDAAHRVRDAGNKAVHGHDLGSDEAWGVLQLARQIVEQVSQRAA